MYYMIMRRIFSFLIDFIVSILIATIITFVLLGIGIEEKKISYHLGTYTFFIYFIVSNLIFKNSFGYKIMKIKIIHVDGNKQISLKQIIFRTFLFFWAIYLITIPPILIYMKKMSVNWGALFISIGLFNFIYYFLSKKKQFLHGLLSKTKVVENN